MWPDLERENATLKRLLADAELVEQSVTADALIDELDRLAAVRGYPAVRTAHLRRPF